jgi:hypothetical protein
VPDELLIEETSDHRFVKDKFPAATRVKIVPPGRTDVRPKPVCVVPSNDTHVYMFERIMRRADALRVHVIQEKDENAKSALDTLGLAYSLSRTKSIRPALHSSLLIANDWGRQELYLLSRFSEERIPSACLQESVVGFNDSSRRMEWCDYPLIQGTVTMKHLERNVYYLTGNPRYELLTVEPLPSTDSLLINSNFTYGRFNDVRERWISDVVQCAGSAKLDYVISQHPRDQGDLSRYNVHRSSPQTIHSAIRSCSVVVTRFSSLIHESLAMGRTVVYYNPHNEKMDYDFEPDGIHLIIARNKRELLRTLEQFKLDLNHANESDAFYRSYLNRHCGSSDGDASNRVLLSLNTITTCNTQKCHVGKLKKWKLQVFNVRHRFGSAGL